MSIEHRIKSIRDKIRISSGKRDPRFGEVTLVAVTKTVNPENVREALSYGIHDIAESRIQEAQGKLETLHDALSGVKKHFIGHLQTNKAKKAVELFDVIQSVDSVRLLAEIDTQAGRLSKVQECLLEVKVSEEGTKFGFAPAEAERIAAGAAGFRHVRLCGLMAMAPYFPGPEQARPYFRRVRALFDRIAAAHPMPGFAVVSMGMSNDFEVAVEEGATQVRIGTGLFGERVHA